MNNLQVVQAAVAQIDEGIVAIHAPFVHAIIDATGEQSEQALTDLINALKGSTTCPWLFDQGKAFALACVEGAVWQNGIKVAPDADELTLHPLADIKGATKWWLKVATAGQKPQSLAGKLSIFCKFLDKASKKGGPELVSGETRAQAAKGAQAMAMVASGMVTFDDIIKMGTLPVADVAPVAAPAVLEAVA